MRLPRILLHALDSESKSVTFGWALASVSTGLYYAQALGFTADRWERMMLISAGLVGAKLIKEGYLEGGAEAPPEAKPDAPKPVV